MKILLRLGLAACAIVSVIGVVLATNDSSGTVVKVVSIIALVAGGVVFQMVKNKVDKEQS